MQELFECHAFAPRAPATRQEYTHQDLLEPCAKVGPNLEAISKAQSALDAVMHEIVRVTRARTQAACTRVERRQERYELVLERSSRRIVRAFAI